MKGIKIMFVPVEFYSEDTLHDCPPKTFTGYVNPDNIYLITGITIECTGEKANKLRFTNGDYLLITSESAKSLLAIKSREKD